MRTLLACLMLCIWVLPAEGQGLATDRLVRVAGPFEQAAELRRDATGWFWLLDAGTGEVWSGPSVRVLALWGGNASTESGRPVDLFVSDGLTLWLADAAGQTVSSYTRRGRLLSERRVMRIVGGGDLSQMPVERDDPESPAGDPGPVAVDFSGDLLLYERFERVLQRWDAAGRAVASRSAGELSEGEVVALDADQSGWVVLTEDRLLLLDPFLETIRSVELADECVPATGLSVGESRVVVASDSSLCTIDPNWLAVDAQAIDLPDPLRDVLITEETLFLVTDRHVWRLE